MELKEGNKIKITGINCGRVCSSRYSCMGILENTIMEIISIQPLKGPIVVKVGESEYSIGRGMFSKLEYEIME